LLRQGLRRCFRARGEVSTIPAMPHPRCRFLIAPLLLLHPLVATAAAERVASMHLCTDQLLVALAQPQQIVSLSYIAADPAYSPIADIAKNHHLNHGQAEELLPLAPDLVLSGAFSTTLAANLLERQGLQVERLGVASSIADQYAQFRQIGALLGAEGKAELMVQQMQAAVAKHSTALQPRLQGKRAAFYSSNGYSYGRGTLQHDFLQSLGLHNSADTLEGVAQLPLEQLLLAAPDYLFIDRRAEDEAPLAHALLQHPALAALAGKLKLLVLPDTLFQCASPHFVTAYLRLEAQLLEAEL
jgi:iron complex transport system substrate-binding protein